jgi:hypothetical protein
VAENILIVGNGFDLSHYLPTKYDHFMDVMDAIDSSNNDEMSFDDLFVKCREEWFIAKTKEYYQTENIHLNKEQLTEIRELLKENCWYQYFKNHVQEIKTWIDFEQKIEKFLRLFVVRSMELQKLEKHEDILNYFNGKHRSIPIISEVDLKILNLFRFTVRESMSRVTYRDPHTGKVKITSTGEFLDINKAFCVGCNPINGFNADSFINHLNSQLNEFIKIFNLYLVEIIQKLNPKTALNIQSENWEQPKRLYSFNYTNTYTKGYNNVTIEYLHGKCGENQNIVLGISDLNDESLKDLKAYGFTKYHQKLFKDTDYLFLNESEQVNSIRDFWRSVGDGKVIMSDQQEEHKLNILIWGHSLDSSDKDYIKEIFSFNEQRDERVRVTVYFFDANAKFLLLNNLLAILGKDKVEKWMKKKWLQFKPNPQIDFGIGTQQQIA